MGYNFRIGEAAVEWDEDRVSIDCEVVELENGPAHGDPTDRTSARWPSYSAWHDSMEALGLLDVMFAGRNKGSGEFEWKGRTYYPLIQEHPGAAPITKAHCEYVEEKLAFYRKQHPDHIAQYPPPRPGAVPVMGDIFREEDLDPNPIYDGNLVRGEWLAFWLRWAVENCKHPVFVNS